MAAQASSFPKKHQRRRAELTASASSAEEQIRQRAYELYLQRGAQPGLEIEDWLQAEAELKDLTKS